jgi:5-methyltetrahydrofolate--homocysteine methyltransferase
MDGHTKGKVVIATVFGDVHDIGKSLVNTILTNNGYTVVDLGKQVPIETIIDAAVEHKADAIGLSALLVSTSKQMPPASRSCTSAGSSFPVLIGGAAINRDFGRRVSTRRARSPTRSTSPASSTARTPSRGSTRWTRWSTRRARRWSTKIRDEAEQLREKPVESTTRRRPTTQRALGRAHRRPIPEPPFWGVREVDDRPRRGLPLPRPPRALQAALGRRGVKGEAWRELVEGTTARRASRRGWSGCGASRTTCTRGRGSATSPATPTATSWSSSTPTTRARARAARLPAPAQARPHLPRRFLPPLDSGERDVVACRESRSAPR